MGDLIGDTPETTLFWMRRSHIDRVLEANAPLSDRLSLVADIARLNTLYMIAAAGSGHIGSSFSSMDIFTTLSFWEKKERSESAFFRQKDMMHQLSIRS